MQIRELITQYKLLVLTMKTIKSNHVVNIQDHFFRKVGALSRDTVNLFRTQMYFRISYLAWYN